MSLYTCEYRLPIGNRIQKHQALIECFLNEIAGTGKKEYASHYQYNVESYKEYTIYLKRPTRLNKGFDFTVNIDGMYFKKNKKYTNPSHQDIFNALTFCKINYYNEYNNKIMDAIKNIYNCNENEVDLSNINAYFSDYEGVLHPIQIILLAIKWLFMEQDCAYWNYSGREMLFNEMLNLGLV